MGESATTKTTVFAALAGNALVAVTKLAAVAYTGSSSMLSEGVHSIVDTGNQCLILYGYRRANRPPDRIHPLGYGRELYFWSFIVAVLLFSLGAGVSLYEGVAHLREPMPTHDMLVNYVVLGLAFVFEAGSWWVAARGFRESKGNASWWQAIRDSKDPPAFMVLLEDSAALLGIAIAALSLLASEQLGIPELDGVGSLLIGLLLGSTALFIARETKALLIGERASRQMRESVIATATTVDGVEVVHDLLTVHLSPTQVVVAFDVEFRDDLTTPEIETCVALLEACIRQRHEDVVALFVKPRAHGTGHHSQTLAPTPA